jgi:hypothetical protein
MIENKKTDLPPKLQSLYKTREQNALSFIDRNDYSAAEQEYRTLLSEFFAAQGAATRYHKGGIYHQIGYCLFLQKKTADALNHFKCAFIEDCISGIEFGNLPAYSNLHNYFGISAIELDNLSQRIKVDTDNNNPLILNAESYLNDYLKKGYELGSPTIEKSKRVFVGGSYKNIAILRYIGDSVRECDFSPMLPIDFEVSHDKAIYPDAMSLLHNCGSAIFEVTFDSGHLMEIERARNYKLFPNENILLLFQKRNNDSESYVTKMLLGVGITPVGYMKIGEIPELVKDFLGKISRDI